MIFVVLVAALLVGTHEFHPPLMLEASEWWFQGSDAAAAVEMQAQPAYKPSVERRRRVASIREVASPPMRLEAIATFFCR